MTAHTLTLDMPRQMTPELRDQLLRGLRARMDRPRYRLLSPEHLRELAEIESTGEPVLSIYLALSPERRVTGAWRTVLANLARPVLQQFDAAGVEAIERQLAAVERALDEQLPDLGRGVAFFVCEQARLWRQYTLPVLLPDAVHAGPRPHIRPLARLRSEGDRHLAVLLSREKSRFLVDHLGQVEEIYRVQGKRIRDLLTDRVPRDRRDDIAAQISRDEARTLARIAEIIAREMETSDLFVSASPDMRAGFIAHLRPRLADRVESFEADLHASAPVIGQVLAPVRERRKQAQEAALVEALMQTPPERVATGLQACLDCLREGRVERLAVDDGFAARGVQCTQCSALFAHAPGESCPICGFDRMREEDDLVDAAVQQALDRDGRFEFIRTEPARSRLAPMGPMVALLRY